MARNLRMGFLIVAAWLAASCWVIRFTFLRLRRGKASARWWGAYIAALLLGVVVGGWVAWNADYRVSERVRFLSFPLPLAFFVWETDRWTDFVTPPYVVYPGLLANTLSIAALAQLPVLILSRRLNKKAAPLM